MHFISHKMKLCMSSLKEKKTSLADQHLKYYNFMKIIERITDMLGFIVTKFSQFHLAEMIDANNLTN